MVGKLTYGKRQWESLDTAMRSIIPPLHAAMLDTLPMVDADTEAFNDYMAAMKLPKDTAEEKAKREAAMEEGLKTAVGVPLSLAKRANTVWDTLLELAAVGNINCKSDLQVAARCLETAVQGAKYNVDINLGNIKDATFKQENSEAASKEVETAIKNRDKVLSILESRK